MVQFASFPIHLEFVYHSFQFLRIQSTNSLLIVQSRPYFLVDFWQSFSGSSAQVLFTEFHLQGA